MGKVSVYAIITALAASLAAAALMLPWLLRFCHKHGLYDVPNERKMHKNNIPRLGGTIFLPSMIVGGAAAIAVANILGYTVHEMQISTVAMLVGTGVIYLTGLFDDVFGLSANLKFCIQLAAALIMPVCGLYVNDMQGFLGLHDLHAVIAYPLTVFVILLVVNSINLIDGIDGLAGSLSCIALAALGTLFCIDGIWAFTVMSATLLSALVVFLYFNLFGSCERHTKTFMGDSGSLILGYTLAYLGLKYAMENTAVMPHRPYAVLAAITVLTVPTFDLVRVAFTRIFQGKPMFAPDKQHIHHRFAAAGFTMHQTLAAIVALQLLYCAVNAGLYLAGLDNNIILLADILIFTGVQVWLGVRIKRK